MKNSFCLFLVMTLFLSIISCKTNSSDFEVKGVSNKINKALEEAGEQIGSVSAMTKYVNIVKNAKEEKVKVIFINKDITKAKQIDVTYMMQEGIAFTEIVAKEYNLKVNTNLTEVVLESNKKVFNIKDEGYILYEEIITMYKYKSRLLDDNNKWKDYGNITNTYYTISKKYNDIVNSRGKNQLRKCSWEKTDKIICV